MRGLFSSPPRPTPREELVRAQRDRFAMSAHLEEIPRKNIEHGPFGRITANGRTFKRCRGALQEAAHTPATAFYVEADGTVVFLEEVR